MQHPALVFREVANIKDIFVFSCNFDAYTIRFIVADRLYHTFELNDPERVFQVQNEEGNGNSYTTNFNGIQRLARAFLEKEGVL